MDKLALEVTAFLKEKKEDMLHRLHTFCEINSGSDHLKGLHLMHGALKETFEPLADSLSSPLLSPVLTFNMKGEKELKTAGEVLFIQKRPELKHRILLCGHMDTVYSVDHPFQTLTYLDEKRLNGPGVADMKGGLVIMLYALTAFEMFHQGEPLGWDVLINADEEIGSNASAPLLSKIASNYQAALVYEPAMSLTGTLAKNRKGSGKFTLIATGQAAHAGRAFDKGRNAICYLADIVTQIHALNGKKEGITINVGRMAGGDALNMVPDHAVAMLDIRITSPEDEIFVREAIDKIAKDSQKEGYDLSIHGEFGRPVKRVNEETIALFDKTKRIGEALGQPLDWQDSGGCCDGNNLAALGVPVLDTLGAIGGDIHTPKEFILTDSLVTRATLSALLLMTLAKERIT